MEAFEGQNWGIIKTVKIIARANVSFSETTNSIDFSNISTLNGAIFEEIPHILESSSFSDSEKNSRAGISWEKKARLTVPKLRTEVSTLFKNYENQKLVLLITDMNDVSHLVYPVRMLRQRTVPGQAVGLNATYFNFSGEYIYESPIVTNVS